MDKIEAYLEKQRKVILEDREETLISPGLFEKEYSPKGKYHYQYKEYDLVDGEKRYYRKKALSVTEEQWAEIVSLRKSVSEIELREEKGVRAPYPNIKKWLPIFVENDENEKGRSRLAFIFRVIAVFWAIIGGIVGLISVFDGEDFGFLTLMGVLISVLLLFALAGILDNIAELLAIIRGGFQSCGSEIDK